MDELTAGSEMPLHRSLTGAVLMAGVPREVGIVNGTFVAALALGLHSWYAIPVGVCIHAVAVAATRRDDRFFVVFRRMLRQKVFYRA